MIKFNDDKIISVKVSDKDKDYFEAYNTKKWLKEVEIYAKNILESGDEVDIPFELKNKYKVDGAFLAKSI